MVSLSFGGLFRAGPFARLSEIGHPVEPLQSVVVACTGFEIVALRYMEGAPTSCEMVTYAYDGNTVFRVSCGHDCRVSLSW